MINTILNHRTIRKYKSDPVPDEIMDRILEAGVRASTTGNMQVYSIILTKDTDIKKQLWESHFKQDMVNAAPVILTFCADFNRFNKWCRNRNTVPGYDNFLSFYTASIDALLVAQNMVLAAEDFGLGICYLGTTTYMAGKIIEILRLPSGVVPVTTIVAGYPDEDPPLTDRLPLKAVVHEEVYHDYSPQDIDRFYQAKESLEETARLIEINKTDNLARIFTEKRYTKKDNVYFSQQYLKAIHDQGFMNNET